MKVLVINPVGTDRWDSTDKKLYENFSSPETEIHVVSLPHGPKSVENRVSEAEALVGVLDLVKRIHKEYDGIIVNCCLDVGVDAIRSIIDTPTVGPCESSLALATVLGKKIGIVTVSKTAVEIFEELVIKYRLEKRVVDIQGIDITVPEIDVDRNFTINLLKEEISKVINNGADVVLLGCTGLAGFAKELQKYFEVPILDPAECAIKVLESIIKIKGGKK